VIRAPPGNYVFVFSEIMDRCDLRATVPFTINGPMISLDLTEGPPGMEVTVQGSGWIAGDLVSIQFAEPGNEVAQATVGDDGSFTTTFTVPSDAQSGEQQVIAVDANDSNWQTDTVFHVTAEGSAPLSLILMGTSLLGSLPQLLVILLLHSHVSMLYQKPVAMQIYETLIVR
jgi:hypothetical protein